MWPLLPSPPIWKRKNKFSEFFFLARDVELGRQTDGLLRTLIANPTWVTNTHNYLNRQCLKLSVNWVGKIKYLSHSSGGIWSRNLPWNASLVAHPPIYVLHFILKWWGDFSKDVGTDCREGETAERNKSEHFTLFGVSLSLQINTCSTFAVPNFCFRKRERERKVYSQISICSEAVWRKVSLV